MKTPRFEMEFRVENAAELDGPAEWLGETARFLRHVADEVEAGKGNAYLFDVNGNKIGGWSFDECEEEGEG